MAILRARSALAAARPESPKPTMIACPPAGATGWRGLSLSCPSAAGMVLDCSRLPVHFPHHDIDRPHDRRHVRQQHVAAQLLGYGEVDERGPADLHAVRDDAA